MMNKKHMMHRTIIFIIVSMMFMAGVVPAGAMHPLITDDTGTQGRGGVQLECVFEHEHDLYYWIDRDPSGMLESFFETGMLDFGRVRTHDDVNTAGLTVSYGIVDPLDIDISIPYQHAVLKENRTYYTGPLQMVSLRSRETLSGLSDITFDFKWRFLEYKALSLCLKPGIIFPVGNESNGLGAGMFGAFGYFITSIDLTPVLMHINLGYIRNQNKNNEREDLWHASMAFEFWLVKDYLRLVANCGFERNPDKRSKIQDLFVLGGLVISPTENCDIDFGFKHGLAPHGIETPGPDYAILGGLTIRFSTITDNIKKDDINEGKEKK